MPENSPTARALLALELIQAAPGTTADRLAERLGVSERAARRYVAVLREAGVPIESTRGPYGGYRVGRGLRLPPLMFTTDEALALVMAVIEGPGDAADDPVASALGKIIRVLPEPVADPAETVRTVSARRTDPAAVRPDPGTTARLVQAAAAGLRVRLRYRLSPTTTREMDVDPWAVVVRHGRWYLLGWSHSKDARRVLRVDRVEHVEALADPFVPPADLDPVQTLEEHLSEGWRHAVDVVVEAPLEEVARKLPRKLGRLEAIDERRTRLVGSTDELDWYAAHLAGLGADFRVCAPQELREEVRELGERLRRAAAD